MFTLKFTLFLPVRTRTRLHSNLLRSVLPLPSWQVDRQPKNWRRSNFVVPGVTVHAMCLNATHPQSSRMMLNCNCSKMLMMLRQIFYRQMRMGNIAPFVWFIQGEPLSNCKQGYILQPVSISCMPLELKLTRCFIIKSVATKLGLNRHLASLAEDCAIAAMQSSNWNFGCRSLLWLTCLAKSLHFASKYAKMLIARGRFWNCAFLLSAALKLAKIGLSNCHELPVILSLSQEPRSCSQRLERRAGWTDSAQLCQQSWPTPPGNPSSKYQQHLGKMDMIQCCKLFDHDATKSQFFVKYIDTYFRSESNPRD